MMLHLFYNVYLLTIFFCSVHEQYYKCTVLHIYLTFITVFFVVITFTCNVAYITYNKYSLHKNNNMWYMYLSIA